MAARLTPPDESSGVAFVADPTLTYIFVPAELKMTFLVQWLYPRVWFSGMFSRVAVS